MKKMLLAALSAGLILQGMAGCGASAESDTGVLAAADYASPLQFTVQNYEKEYYNGDQTILLGDFHYMAPKLVPENENDRAEEIADRFNQAVDTDVKRTMDEWEQIIEEDTPGILELIKDFPDRATMYYSNETTTQVQQFGDLSSLEFTRYVFCGGVHGYTDYIHSLFDMERGEFVSVNDMTDRDEEMTCAVINEIMCQIEEHDIAVQAGYWEEYPVYVEEYVRSGMKHRGIEGWGLSFVGDTELYVLFPAYELASYAAGPQDFTIPQEVYAPYLNDYGKELLHLKA